MSTPQRLVFHPGKHKVVVPWETGPSPLRAYLVVQEGGVTVVDPLFQRAETIDDLKANHGARLYRRVGVRLTQEGGEFFTDSVYQAVETR